MEIGFIIFMCFVWMFVGAVIFVKNAEDVSKTGCVFLIGIGGGPFLFAVAFMIISIMIIVCYFKGENVDLWS